MLYKQYNSKNNQTGSQYHCLGSCILFLHLACFQLKGKTLLCFNSNMYVRFRNISVKSFPNRSNLFPACSQDYSKVLCLFRIFYRIRDQLRSCYHQLTANSVRLGQFRSYPLGLCSYGFLKILRTFLSVWNILFRHGTSPIPHTRLPVVLWPT